MEYNGTPCLTMRLNRASFVVFLLLAVASPAICSAQLGDIFENALEKVSGFNAWVSLPRPTSPGADQTITLSPRVAFSVKYGPFGIGSKEDRWATRYVERTYTPLPVTVRDGDTCRPCLEEIDSSSWVEIGDDWEREGRTKITRIVKSCPQCLTTSDTLNVIKAVPKNHFTLAFGYSYAPEMKVATDSGFNTSFPLSGFFIQGLVRPLPGLAPGIVLGIGGSLLSMGDATGTLHDTSVISFKSGLLFAPQVTLGVGGDLGFIAEQLKGLAVFADFGFEYARFGGLSYSVPGEEVTLKDFYADLPKTLNLSNLFLRVGISLTTSSD